MRSPVQRLPVNWRSPIIELCAHLWREQLKTRPQSHLNTDVAAPDEDDCDDGYLMMTTETAAAAAAEDDDDGDGDGAVVVNSEAATSDQETAAAEAEAGERECDENEIGKKNKMKTGSEDHLAMN